ncbi:hypothetical protein PCASD_04648 [Puccinia coronata f. sp. avenae]|uniref:Uncharacterized protein n=1 Tax=Puccinia coronata f. sp. avenae TaxID=200324 RepID=A0A2N5UXF8_9BASI|nr:hypothetical protein PCASD_04648 [Puccinia coronata f. sp. avenae]
MPKTSLPVSHIDRLVGLGARYTQRSRLRGPTLQEVSRRGPVASRTCTANINWLDKSGQQALGWTLSYHHQESRLPHSLAKVDSFNYADRIVSMFGLVGGVTSAACLDGP